MFNFFSDVKNRLTALENEVKTIYAHLRGQGATPVVEAPAELNADVTEETKNG